MPTSKKQVLLISGMGVYGKVANYSALPAPALHDGETWICLNSQGTSWLPGSFGGTWYDKGQYYSDGTQWIYDSNSYQASQSDVNTGTITDQWVSPSTLANSIWAFTVAKVLATALTGLNTALTGTITSSDTILTAFGRMQNQVTAIVTALSSYVTLTGSETLTNKTIKKRILVVTQSATPSTNIDNADIVQITSLAQAITSMTTNLTGTPYDGQMIMWQITDNGTARSINWGASFASTSGATLPTTTVISTMLRVITQYNSVTSKHECQYVN